MNAQSKSKTTVKAETEIDPRDRLKSVHSIKWIQRRGILAGNFLGSSPPSPGEVRCYKHSPRVVPQAALPSVEKHDFEMNKWQETFNTMGQLRALGNPTVRCHTSLNKAPYHCSSLGRRFGAAHGALSQVKLKSDAPVTFEAGPSLSKKEKEPQTFCNCVDRAFLPPSRTKSKTMARSYRRTSNAIGFIDPTRELKIPRSMPLSTVRVTWALSGSPHVIKYTYEEVCEWLTKFGPIVFSIIKGTNYILVVFETLTSAKAAVDYPMPIANRLYISWYHHKLANFGSYNSSKTYQVSTDDDWLKRMDQRRKQHRAA